MEEPKDEKRKRPIYVDYMMVFLAIGVAFMGGYWLNKPNQIHTTNVEHVVNNEIDSILKGAIDSMKVVNQLSSLNNERQKTVTIIREKQDPRYEKFIQSIIGLRPDSTIEPHYQSAIRGFDSLCTQTNFITRK